MALWLNEADIRGLISMPTLIPAMARALTALSAGKVRQPIRGVIEMDSGRSFFASMPAFASEIPALGAKLVTVFAGNPARGLTSHLATILLLDENTGALLAVMDGRYITEARTAAVSAVAARHLSAPHSAVLAILGSGVQARSHLEALCHVRDFSTIRCWSPSAANLRRFVDEQRVQPAESAELAVRGADIVVLATDSAEPVIRNAWVRDGACVISVGACRPNQREVDPDLLARASLYVDSRASALEESGDVVLGIRERRFDASHIAAELGEVVANPALGCYRPDRVTVFKSLGLAVEDLASAQLAYLRAVELGKGVTLA